MPDDFYNRHNFSYDRMCKDCCIDTTKVPCEAVESKRIEALELVVSYAKDIVDFWPQFSLRQIPVMAAKVKALKEALGMVK